MKQRTGSKISLLTKALPGVLGSLTIFMSSVLPIWATPKITISYSKSYVKEVRSDIYDAIDKMEEMLDEQYVEAKEEIKQQIKDKNWDYEYTMQDFENQGNPYSGMDYTSIIAAYTTALEESSSGYFYDIPILSVKAYGEKVPGDTKRQYGRSVFSLMSANDIFSYCGLDIKDPELLERFNTRTQIINDVLDGSNLGQNIFVKTIEGVQSDDTNEEIYAAYIPTGLDDERNAIVHTALSLVGQIPYEWGGKPDGPEYDYSWWTFDEETGVQKGLDCSGFVQWVYMTVGYPSDVTTSLGFTGSIATDLEEISEDKLQPGDIGLMNETQSSMNHTGIYLGNGKWIHCASSAGTVVVNDGCFSYFRRAPIGTMVDGNTPKLYSFNRYTVKLQYTENISNGSSASDVYLLAKLMQHEAEGEGYNGWAAVGEVVMNRIKSDRFPNTVSEVVFEEGQFENFTEETAETIIPKSEIISCAAAVYAGQIRIFDNEDVLFFKNPMLTDDISASEKQDWGEYKWYCSVGHHAFYTE